MIGLLAHAAPINYKFPLPIWLYVAAGGAAVLLSAPAAALAVTEGDAIERRGPDVYRFVRLLGPILTVLGIAIVLVALPFWRRPPRPPAAVVSDDPKPRETLAAR
jgi:hypothetical protein